jgi:hypothetical protein
MSRLTSTPPLRTTPIAATDNGTIESYTVANTGTFAGSITVNSSGVVSISNAAPSGTHTITVRAVDNCGAISDATFALTVNDAPSFAINDVAATEGDTGTTAYVFTVTKTGSTSLSASVSFATSDGTATIADGDYAAATGTLTFAPGETTKQITVEVNGDTVFESDEAFKVNLTNPINATVADANGTGTLTNDDAAPTFLIDSVSHAEGDSGQTAYIFTVTKSGVSSGSSTVEYATADGSAAATDGDYVHNSGTLTFQPTETMKTITVQVNGDRRAEPDETFTVQLSDVVNNSRASA